jgi:hypothetical protein
MVSARAKTTAAEAAKVVGGKKETNIAAHVYLDCVQGMSNNHQSRATNTTGNEGLQVTWLLWSMVLIIRGHLVKMYT